MGPDEITPEDFQVCVTIIEARHLAWKTINPVVCVQVDNKKKYTVSCGPTDCPYYNESFVFEFRLPFPILMEKTITLSVLHSTKLPIRAKELGRTTLDIGTVWLQPNHQFYHKWAVLLDRNDYSAGAKGYLKCDLTVVGKGEIVKVHPTHEDEEDDIEGNLLVAEHVKAERQTARYTVRVYRADDVPHYVHARMKKKDKIDPYVEVSFAGLRGRTSVKKNTWQPIWNEELIFNDAFPPLWKRIRFQIRDSDAVGHTVIATHLLSLTAISNEHSRRGFLPMFGPTFIHLYGSSGRPQKSEGWAASLGDRGSYRGKLLIALDTVMLDYTDVLQAPARQNVTLQKTPAIDETRLWVLEPIALVGVVWGVSMMSRSFADKELLVEISLGNFGNTSIIHGKEVLESRSTTSAKKPVKQHEGAAFYSLSYGLEKPVLTVSTEVPNLRHRMYLSNLLHRLALKLGSELLWAREERVAVSKLDQVRQVLQGVDDACSSFLNLTRSRRFTAASLGVNLLDRERLRSCRQRVEQLRNNIDTMESSLNSANWKYTLDQLTKHLEPIQELVEDPQDALPDVFLWLLTRKGKRLGFYRIPARNLLFSIVPEERGLSCGKLQTIILQPRRRRNATSQIGASPARVEIALWVGHLRHTRACFKNLPRGFGVPDNEADQGNGGGSVSKIPKTITYEQSHRVQSSDKRITMNKPSDMDEPLAVLGLEKQPFVCLAYVYQGRLIPGGDKIGLSDPFVRVVFGGHNRDTKVIAVTLSPTWDETLIFERLQLCGDVRRIKINPPTIILEAIDRDKHGKTEHIGRTSVRPTVVLSNEKLIFPRMKWHPLFLGTKITAEILAAFHLIEFSDSITGLPPMGDMRNRLIGIPENIKPTLVPHRLEVIFWGTRELQKVDLLTVKKPHVVLECGNYKVTSSSGKCFKENCDFSDPLRFIDLMLPLEAEYYPPLTIKLYERRNIGKAVYVGTHIDNSIGHFLIQLTTPEERQLMLSGTVFPRPRPKKIKAGWRKLESSPLLIPQSTTRGKRSNLTLWEKLCKCFRRSDTKNGSKNGEHYEDEDKFDWWVKYYESRKESTEDEEVSRYITAKKRTTDEAEVVQRAKKVSLKIYDSELESQPEFGGFQDAIQTFEIIRGKTSDSKFQYPNIVVGKFKGAIRVYQWPDPKKRKLLTPTGRDATKGVLQDLPPNIPVRLVMRLYVVRATGLRSHDFAGRSDPYLEVQIGDRIISDKENYVPGQLEPVFGRCFELEIVLPRDHLLTVRLIDHDVAGRDDFLGETKIDLENRFYTRHRATCGLSRRYDTEGYNFWRDVMTPREILGELCQRVGLPSPYYYGNHVFIGRFTLEDIDDITADEPFLEFPEAEEEEEEETLLSEDELALIALRHWHQVPGVGFHLVPEHVETRSLYHFQKPAFEQGKLEMWVDLLPFGELPLPPQVDILPRKPVTYELRVIIWNTEDVVLQEDTFFGESMSDIYVKGFVVGEEDSQVTDVHYRSLTGEGNFNWRFVFRFAYLAADNKIVVARKKIFHREPTETKQPCQLTLQVWDNDTFSADDFLGCVTLDLAVLCRGAKTAAQCDLSVIASGAPKINLFRVGRTKGWWPFYTVSPGDNIPQLSGKVEAELVLLNEEEADNNPVGVGREAPEPLEKPQRPDTSFLWFKNPWRSFKYILWRRYKKCFFITLAVLLLILFIVVAVYSFPGYGIKFILGV